MAQLKKVKNNLERAHRWEINMCKQESLNEAKRFVREAANNIQRAVTREYRTLLKQFVQFREKTWHIIDNMEDRGARIQAAEQLVSQTYPVYDSRYRADPDSPFKLYDCMKPALKEQIRVPEVFLAKDYLEDAGMQLLQLHDKFDLEKEDLTY